MQAGSVCEQFENEELAALWFLHMFSSPACNILFERSLGHQKGTLAVPLRLQNVLNLHYTEQGMLRNMLE